MLLADLLEGKGRLDDYAGLVIPGGFSYGDHLPRGASSLFTSSPGSRRSYVHSPRPAAVLGICNGDQVLMETGLPA